VKIGLIRHFKVTRGYPNKLVTSDELMNWVKEYDKSDVEENEVDLGSVRWKHCFSSDLPRARTTAEKCFEGKIIYIEELREVALSPLFRVNIRLPLMFHLFFIRVAWIFNHRSQPEKRKDVLSRINKALDLALYSGEDVLIVSHGGVMMYMRKELLKRGFRGPKFRRPENGLLYLFENDK
jgi:broad specificity phosphatase PhoE